MSIKTTIDISRESAIDRIEIVARYIAERNYVGLEQDSHEPSKSVKAFIDEYSSLNVSDIEKWTNKMIEDVMDSPFFRYSYFDNYLISTTESI